MTNKPLGTEEDSNIPVKRYRDQNGEKTCASDFSCGRVCMFYATQRMGMHETCWFLSNSGAKLFTPLQRRNNGKGTLIPAKECPVWSAE